jgi:hypothetical protein
MADYTPLIARAIEGLERNTGENRRELYERARKALLAQLRGIEPALDETEITRERLALEEAIRSVETDAVKRSREQNGQDGHEGNGQGDHAPVEAPHAAPPPTTRTLADQALAGFRENLSEADGLGEAAAQANKSARDFYRDQDRNQDRNQDRAPPLSRAPRDVPPMPENGIEPSDHPSPATEEGWEAASPPPLDDEDAYRPRRSYRGLITAIVILLVLGGIAAAGYWQRDNVVAVANKAIASLAALRSSTPATPPPRAATTPSQPKIADRVGQPDKPAAGQPATAPAADVAQKVVLYEEDPKNPQGKRYVGSAIWRTETVSPGPGLAPELAVRCDVEIPERHLRMTWSLRRNTDKALPASHTIEIMFTLPADFSEGGIQNVPGVLMKQNEQARGVPLAGLAVKVTNGFFLIGLNSSEVDLARNIALLKERPWFDIPIVYNNNKRAILAVEKGTPGERAFQDAFRAWGQ